MARLQKRAMRHLYRLVRLRRKRLICCTHGIRFLEQRIVSLMDQSLRRGSSKRVSFARKQESGLLEMSSLEGVGLVPGTGRRTRSVGAQERPGLLQALSGPAYQEQTPEQLQELVAPIALYPDLRRR